MKVIKGNCGGITFRDNKNTNTAYHFQVCQNGTYALILYGPNKISTLLEEHNPLIKTGIAQANRIEVIAIESLFILYINTQKIASISDTTYIAGFISLRASAYGAPVEVVYNDARLWEK